ncbi:hypothetical protein conserved [Leishmania donovani]|uniref:Uncharacterized protein n=3 Tax=Leishmania donovani species complex TaxID=38574 RepID=E9AI06_LEIIN|nr:conserved hypothetical protein [Leishmania infantum JPCM5]XP_003865816.1 hypothetical protein, conserved [Leishmania donovani]CAC9553429.1 hypothetical_protein_-_conserved [Leishmania infantum]AYU84111.1 hypothetical protein LdCL_360083100 [Leishmania donovani]TPP49466.1 hypothetical protein CGC20_18715 [Leishmania donovani]TPP53366.1 hypothetical protein CGC21_38750 [Leishmania donovani]CAJ1994092.1 hypothetical protein conserved [Leishmania donovani]|eukprot:XP_003392857.1 conserved hypothetical protein [Leishmania infantum JPCM5]
MASSSPTSSLPSLAAHFPERTGGPAWRPQASADTTWTLHGLLLTDLWEEPLHTRSRTRDRLGYIDFGMVIPPIRAFLYSMLIPYACYPIALVHLYGFYRCTRTMVFPKYYKRQRYSDRVMYGVQKRVYDTRQKRILESQVDDVQEIQHALEVVGAARNQFVDDPHRKGTAYFVVEQKIMKAEAIFTGENWAWAFISDTCRYVTPMLFAYLFHPSCKRLTVDLRLWRQGRLHWRQARHPVLNFFKTYNEYNQAMRRINVTKPAPKGAQPWSRNL